MDANEKLKKEQREIALFMAKAAELLARHEIKRGDSKDAERTPKNI